VGVYSPQHRDYSSLGTSNRIGHRRLRTVGPKKLIDITLEQTCEANRLGSISLALIGEMALNLCVMENLYEACPLSGPSELRVSLLLYISFVPYTH
jgi:hypothetical protein